jgi:predicted DCC family thiol-disulfide oxidoreductase YuxK
MNEISKIKVYYNSACPVCDAGINAQKNKSSECAIDWNDIHTNNELVQDVSDDIEYVRERLHVVDENNEVFVGINAFIAIWRHSPKERWKATLLSLPIIKPFANCAYNIFARLLYQWNRKRSSW